MGASTITPGKPTRVFLSYAWEDDDYRLLVKKLAVRLTTDGIEARLDDWHLRGQTIPEFMNSEVRNADKVLIICSPAYRRKVHAMEDQTGISGVGWESMLVTSAIWTRDLSRDRVEVVLLRGEWRDSSPSFLSGFPYLDLTKPAQFEPNYLDLLRRLSGLREGPPKPGLLRLGLAPQLVQPLTAADLGPSLPRPASINMDDSGLIQPPGIWRYLLDRMCPAIHERLRRIGTVTTPSEYDAVTTHLQNLQATIENEIKQKTYIPNIARQVPIVPFADREGVDPFVQPIHQIIREIAGREKGGDSASAQTAALNRKSRIVRNLLKGLQRSVEPLILLGDPGTGKTLTLQQVALAQTRSELRRVFPAVTLYVRLGEFHVEGKVSPASVLDYVKLSVAPELRRLIHALDQAGRLVILFDGLDEMSRERYTEHTEALSQFAAARRRRTKTLFSCRITDFSPSFVHQRLVLLPFGRSQIADYLKRYFPERYVVVDGKPLRLKRLARQLATGEFSVDATNPFILWLLCFHLSNKHAWPESRVKLQEFFVEESFHRKQVTSDSELPFPEINEAMKVWGRFAYLITERNLGTAISVSELAEEPIFSREHVDYIVRVGRRCGVLAESSELFPHQVRFDHHRLQEFFTAYHIHKSRTQVEWLSKLDAPRWQETMVNLIVMGGGEDAVNALGEAIIQRVAMLEQSRKPKESQKKAIEGSKEAEEVEEVDEVEKGKKGKKGKKGEEEEDPVREHEETLLADRVELGARIVREGRKVAMVQAALMPILQESVASLIKHGNPITQLKMVRACVRIPDPKLIDVARRPLTSKVTWLRNQALILLSESGLGANLPTEMGYDVARGALLRRLPAYIKAISDSHQRGALSSLILAGLCSMLILAFLLAAAAGFYLGVAWAVAYSPLLYSMHDVFLDRRAMLLSAGVVLCVLFFTVRKSPGLLWAAILGATALSMATPLLVVVLWSRQSGSGGEFFGFGILVCTVWLVAAMAYATITHFLALGIYLVLTARGRVSENRWTSFFVTAWEECSFNLLPEIVKSIAREAGKLLLGGIGLFLIVLALGFLWSLTGLRAWPILAQFFKKIASLWQALMLYSGRLVVILILTLIAAATSFLLFKVLQQLIQFARRRPFPQGSFTAEYWKQQFAAGNAASQYEFLLRTNHQSLALAPKEFLIVLREIGPSVKGEPAVSTYWERRNELEELLKQERSG